MNNDEISRFQIGRKGRPGRGHHHKYDTLYLCLEPSSTNYQDLEEQIPSLDTTNITIERLFIASNEDDDSYDDSMKEASPNYDSKFNTMQLVCLLQKICRKFDGIKEIDFFYGYIPLVALCTILIEAKKLEELVLFSVHFMTGSESLLDSLGGINNMGLKESLIKDIKLHAFDCKSNKNTTISLQPAELASCIVATCPKLEDLRVEEEDVSSLDFTVEDWDAIFSRGQCLKHLAIELGDCCPAFLTALANVQPSSSLQEVEIFLNSEEDDCASVANFLRHDQQANHPVTKLAITVCIGDEDAFDFSLIARALKENKALDTFRVKFWGEGPCWLDDECAEALATSILHNPRLTCVESAYQNIESDHVKNIKMYLAVNRHKALVLEEGNTAATKLLWIHMLGLHLHDLNYLYHILLQNPSLCILKDKTCNSPKRYIGKRKICSAACEPSKKQATSSN